MLGEGRISAAHFDDGAGGDNPLGTLVPTLAVELAAEVGHRHAKVPGSMLSADISGFTALSERLASRGKAGAEQLTDLINTCFTALIGRAERHGGEVLKFGGDAILVLFRSEDHVLRSVAAAAEMQEALLTLGPARRANLTMTVGVHSGEFDVYLVGTHHRELLVTGRDATEVIRLEGDAAHGQTLVSASLADRIPEDLTEPLDTGDFLLAAGPGGLRRLPDPAPPVGPLADLIVRNVADELAAIDQLGGEHRVVAVGFVMIQGVGALVADAGFAGTADALGHLVDRIHEIADRYGVTPLHTDIADDGVKYVLCAGAPVNEGSITDGLMLAASEIAEIDSPLVVRQGLQLGRCFAGFLGAPHRRAYTLMGDPVNTAARMLGPAGDRDVVAVDDLVSATHSVFQTDTLPPLTVKGKSAPITAHKIVGTTTQVRAGSSLGPLVGRDAEVATIGEIIERGHGVVEFIGAAGLGKSRLMAHVESSALAAGLSVFRAGAHPYATARPYGVLADLLEQWLELDDDPDPVARSAQLRRVIEARVPASAADLDVLAIPLGAESQSGAVDGLDVGHRREMVHRSITDLLTRLHPAGLALIIEDLHWIDAASGEALSYLAQRAEEHTLQIFATRRNEGLFSFADDDGGDEAGTTGDVVTVELTVLSDDAVKQIAIGSATRDLSDHELDSVARRAAGNPLFAVEVARAISESDSGEIPDSVERVIAGRLDRASPEARRMLRVLSVWGDEFDWSLVKPLMDELAVTADPRSVDLAGIIDERSPGTWGFTHALHREVAYEGLPYKRRREFHRRIGGYLEAQASDPMAIAGILSVHYDRGGQHDRAWVYCREAGEQAERQLAQVEALDAYQRALDAGRYVDVPNAELADTAIKLGDAAEHAGQYDIARKAYKKARSLVPAQDSRHLSTYRKLGTLDEREGRYVSAQRWYRRGMKAALAVTPRVDRGEWLQLTVAMGAAEFRRGRARETWELMLPLAEDKRAPAEVRYRACYLLQLSGTYLNEPEAVRYGELALELVDLVRDPVLHGNLVNNLGIAAYFGGRWDAAADLYEESYRLRDGAGDVLGAVMALNNLGEIRSDQHRFAEARRYFDDALRRGRAANTRLLIYVLEGNLGRLATRSGELEEAAAWLEAALEGFTEIGSSSFIPDTEQRLAELAAAKGEWAEADDRAARLLLGAAERGASAAETAPLIRIRAGAARAAGNLDQAEALVREALTVAQEGGIRYQRAWSSLELAELLGDDPEAEDHRIVASELFEALGVNVTR